MGHKGPWMPMGLIYIQSFHEEMVVYPKYSFEVIVELPRYIYIYTWTRAVMLDSSRVVRSSLSCGRIKVQHDMPSGKPCHNKQWHVPEKNAQRKTRKKK